MKFASLIVSVVIATASGASLRNKSSQYRGGIQVVHDEETRRVLRAHGGCAVGSGCGDAGYQGGVSVTHQTVMLEGFVFHDMNRNSMMDEGEAGIEGVMVSNGHDVVKTDAMGFWSLPGPTEAEEAHGVSYFITEPDCYDTPINDRNIPQFFYVHKPEGTPANVRGETFRYEGLAPTGPLPVMINFPLIDCDCKSQFKMVISGDPQTYSNTEVGYMRDSIIREVAQMDDIEGIVFNGDVMGDDLSLYKRFGEIVQTTGVKQYYVAGNHDLDFDATTDEHSFDTFRREFGPEYYSWETGNVHFVVMDNVVYPCTEADNDDGVHEFCETGTTYTGKITERQLQWLANDLAHVPKDKLIFLQMHIPIFTFIDQNLAKHMTSNAVDLYEVLGCSRNDEGYFAPEDCERPVIAIGAHSHTNENMLPGEFYEGFSVTLDEGGCEGRAPGPVPFHILICGAASGSWWSGDFNAEGVPESFQRLGAPKGYWIFDFDGSSYMETFKPAHYPIEKQMSVDILTPEFEEWYTATKEWYETGPAADAIPPVNINDLPDTHIVVPSSGTSYLSANVFAGSREHKVHASFDHCDPIEMTRTNPGEGENILVTLDPFALKRQMNVARFALVSSSNEPRSNGFELFKGSVRCPGSDPTACTPRPLSQGRWTDQSTHVWQVAIPEDLENGTHVAAVKAVDQYGREFSEAISFEIYDERPPAYFKSEDFAERP